MPSPPNAKSQRFSRQGEERNGHIQPQGKGPYECRCAKIGQQAGGIFGNSLYLTSLQGMAPSDPNEYWTRDVLVPGDGFILNGHAGAFPRSVEQCQLVVHRHRTVLCCLFCILLCAVSCALAHDSNLMSVSRVCVCKEILRLPLSFEPSCTIPYRHHLDEHASMGIYDEGSRELWDHQLR